MIGSLLSMFDPSIALERDPFFVWVLHRDDHRYPGPKGEWSLALDGNLGDNLQV
jgi:hypothetical protein